MADEADDRGGSSGVRNLGSRLGHDVNLGHLKMSGWIVFQRPANGCDFGSIRAMRGRRSQFYVRDLGVLDPLPLGRSDGTVRAGVRSLFCNSLSTRPCRTSQIFSAKRGTHCPPPGVPVK